MVVGTVRILPSPNRRLEVLEMLRSIQGPVLAERGCLAFDIYDEESADRAVVLVERWETQQALEAHLRSDAYWCVLEAIELSGAPPGVRYDHVSASEGIELVERTRASSPAPKPTRVPSRKTDSNKP
jgi:quinol monooxygenase YgiN